MTGDLTITSTDDSATEDPNLKLFRNSSSPATSDNIGTIQFQAKNSADETITFVEMQSQIGDVTDGIEDGNLFLQVRNNGSLLSFLHFSGVAKRVNIGSDIDLYLQEDSNLVFEGATSNSNETTLTVTDPSQDNTITLPDATGTVLLKDANDDVTIESTDDGSGADPTLVLYRNSASPAAFDSLGKIEFKGKNSSGADHTYFYMQAQASDETAGTEDGVLYFYHTIGGNENRLIAGMGYSAFTAYGQLKINASATYSNPSLVFEGATDNSFETTVRVVDPTADNIITLPDATGTVALQEQAYQAINAQTGTTYATVLADGGKLVTLSNASAITLTIPPNSSVAYPVGTKLDFIQIGAGQVTVAGGAGVTVNSTPTLKFRAQHSGASCIKIATDTWQLVGDLAAS
jgi:hypothetical protein